MSSCLLSSYTLPIPLLPSYLLCSFPLFHFSYFFPPLFLLSNPSLVSFVLSPSLWSPCVLPPPLFPSCLLLLSSSFPTSIYCYFCPSSFFAPFMSPSFIPFFPFLCCLHWPLVSFLASFPCCFLSFAPFLPLSFMLPTFYFPTSSTVSSTFSHFVPTPFLIFHVCFLSPCPPLPPYPIILSPHYLSLPSSVSYLVSFSCFLHLSYCLHCFLCLDSILASFSLFLTSKLPPCVVHVLLVFPMSSLFSLFLSLPLSFLV